MFQLKYFFKVRSFFAFVFIIGIFLISGGVFSQEKRENPSLSKSYPLETLKKILITRENWKPFPTANERQPWISLPEEFRKGHIALGEKGLGYLWR